MIILHSIIPISNLNRIPSIITIIMIHSKYTNNNNDNDDDNIDIT